MCENTVDTQQDLLRYKQMYLRMDPRCYGCRKTAPRRNGGMRGTFYF